MARTVDEYIESFPEPVQPRLRELRELSQANAPHATVGIKWGTPAYSVETILFIFAGYTKHASFFVTPSTREAFSDNLLQFTTGKGSVRLPYDGPLPGRLLVAMIAYRVREFEVDGVRWM